MKQRIANKKLKNDILINIWIKRWRHSIDIMNNVMASVTKNDYENHDSIWYYRFKLCRWSMEYEFMQIIKIGRKNYSIKTKQVYEHLLKRNFVAFNYNQFKKYLSEI